MSAPDARANALHAALLADAVLHIRATSPRLADIYRDFPTHRASLWGTWSRESPTDSSITPEARARLRLERLHWVGACVEEGQCHGRGFRGTA